MKNMKLLFLAIALLALAPLTFIAKSFATAPDALGGSAFPLTFIQTSPINLVDGFNQMLQIINAQTTGISVTYPGAIAEPATGVDTSGTPFSASLQGNPLQLHHYDDVTLAQINSVKTVITGATNRTVYPGNLIVMASGSAAGATSISLKCSVSGTVIATFPIAQLVNNVPVTAFTSGATPGQALAKGCSSGDGIITSIAGSALTTTTDLYINLPYTVQ